MPVEPLGPLGPVERLVGGRVGEHYVWVRETVGRGTTAEVDGERYLPEAVTKELGAFYARVVPVVVLLAGVLGFLFARVV